MDRIDRNGSPGQEEVLEELSQSSPIHSINNIQVTSKRTFGIFDWLEEVTH